MNDLRVMILEDDPVTASVYEEYLRRLPGVRLVRVAVSREAALRFLIGHWRVYAEFGVDLLLVDMNLPDGHGLDVLRHLRSAGWDGGALALTAASERQVVRSAMALGITDYLLKPFTFEDFASRVSGYRDLDRQLGAQGVVPSQDQLDEIFSQHTPHLPQLPKGLTPGTLSAVREGLEAADGPLSASELGEVAGLSRVTARRYLEHLVATGLAVRAQRHGTPGRPEVEYAPTR